MSDEKQLAISNMEKAGQALFGKQWQSDLTRALGLKDSRRMRQFMSGDRPIPPGIWNDLLEILKARQVQINDIIDLLEKNSPQP